MKKMIFWLILLFFLDGLMSIVNITAQPTHTAGEIKVYDSKEIVFFSDLQAPIFLEKIYLKSERNEEATDSLFADIHRRKPSSVFFLGDIVALGLLNSEWKTVDKNLEQFKKENVPTFATPGNHEYMLIPKLGIDNFQKKFSSSSINGFYKVVDSVAIVMINSEKIKDAEQIGYYKQTMQKLENDNSVKMIIISTHYSPFTNSSVVQANSDVRDVLVSTMKKTSKAKLLLSGHSHNLEYFRENGKNFIVIGGGGGLKQDLKKNTERNWVDLIEQSKKPRFFYLIVKRNGDTLQVTARGFQSEDFKFFELPILTISTQE